MEKKIISPILTLVIVILTIWISFSKLLVQISLLSVQLSYILSIKALEKATIFLFLFLYWLHWDLDGLSLFIVLIINLLY